MKFCKGSSYHPVKIATKTIFSSAKMFKRENVIEGNISVQTQQFSRAKNHRQKLVQHAKILTGKIGLQTNKLYTKYNFLRKYICYEIVFNHILSV
jgi:hypothetical protein